MRAIFGRLKLLVSTGGATTSMLAVAAAPAIPSFVVTVEVVFTHVPAAVPMTLTEKTQDEGAASEAPDRLIVLDPEFAVMVPEKQDPVMPLGVATTKPAGRVSVNDTLLSGLI